MIQVTYDAITGETIREEVPYVEFPIVEPEPSLEEQIAMLTDILAQHMDEVGSI